MTEFSTPVTESGAPVRRGPSLYLLGPVLAVASIPAYLLLIDIPLLRATAIQSFSLMMAGVVLGFLALRRDPRRRVRITAFVNLAFLILGTAMFFVAARLPQSTSAPAEHARAVDFTLPDQTGRPVRLASLYERGPLLLVFYRGHW